LFRGKRLLAIDLILGKDNNEAALIEAFRLSSVDTGNIKKHIDKSVTNYNALGTPTFLLIYAGSSDFGDFWSRLLVHLKQYNFELECKRPIEEKVHPNASTRVCDCIFESRRIRLSGWYFSQLMCTSRAQFAAAPFFALNDS
jgi:hypothetical protein